VGAAVAIAGQWLVDLERRTTGLLLLLTGAVLVATTTRDHPSERRSSAGFPPTVMPRAAWVALGAIGLVALAGGALADPLEPGAAYWLSVAFAIAAAVGTGLWADRRHRPAPEAHADGVDRDDGDDRDDRDAAPASGGRAGSAPWILVGVIIAVAAVAMRTRLLTTLPEGIWYDESDHGLLARRMLDGAAWPRWVEGAYNSPGFHSWLIAGLMWLGAGPIAAMRGVSVMLGLAGVVGAWLVGRELWGRVGASTMAGLFAVSHWTVTLSRIGMFNIATPSLTLCGLGLALLGRRTRRLTVEVCGGLVLGLGLWFHVSMVPAIVGVLAVLGATAGGWRWALRSLAPVAAGIVIAGAPSITIALVHPDLYNARADEVSVFRHHGGQSLVDALVHNARAVIGMFHVAGDRNGRHNLPGEPMLDPISGGLLIVGLALAIRRCRNGSELAWLGWGAIALIPAVVTVTFEAPNSLRAIAVLPVVFALVTAAVIELTERLPRVWTPIAVYVLIAGTALWTTKDYFVDWRNDPDVWVAHSIEETLAARTAARQPVGSEIFVTPEQAHPPVMALLAPDATIIPLGYDDSSPIPFTDEMDGIVLAGSEYGGLVDAVVAGFPSAEVSRFRRHGVDAGAAVRIPRAAIVERQGLVATYVTPAGTSVVVEREPGSSAPVDARARWEGLLLNDSAGPLRLELREASDVVVTIDGHDVADDTVVQQGAHHLVIEADHVGPGAPSLWWRPGDAAQATLVPPERMWRVDGRVSGLWGTARTGTDGSGAVTRGRLDAVVDFPIGQLDAPRPRQLRWTGFVDVPTTGTYTFVVETRAGFELQIDGRPLDRIDERRGTATLTAGSHAIDLAVLDDSTFTRVRLAWEVPGGALATIPPAVLSPPWTSDAGERGE
jgi:4-amino-4-deoxy-L-arabinose transferase-like glycosyltransferase